MGVDGSVHLKTPQKGKEEYMGETYKLVVYKWGKIFHGNFELLKTNPKLFLV